MCNNTYEIDEPRTRTVVDEVRRTVNEMRSVPIKVEKFRDVLVTRTRPVMKEGVRMVKKQRQV